MPERREIPAFLAELFITSTVHNGDEIEVAKTDNHKCGRCWRHLPEVKSDGDLVRPLRGGGEWLSGASAFSVALVVFALDQLAKWIVTGPLALNQLGDQLVLLPIFNFTYTAERGHLARPAQRRPTRSGAGCWSR